MLYASLTLSALATLGALGVAILTLVRSRGQPGGGRIAAWAALALSTLPLLMFCGVGVIAWALANLPSLKF